MEDLINIKASERQTDAWGGVTGIAHTITAELPNGKRAVVRKSVTRDGYILQQGRVSGTASAIWFDDKPNYTREISEDEWKRLKDGETIF